MRSILATCLLLSSLSLAAQQFGGNPPSLKWQQINTDTVRVIFPKGLSTQGERAANIALYLNKYTRESIGNLERKVDIVLQNQTMISNGYVQLGPFRSEFYMTPSPSSLDLGSLNWVDQLAIHEYRHVLQNMNFRQGLSKVFSILGGQLGQAAATNIAVPNWFWEGDAVVMETALSPQGRGRLPEFFDGFRALALAHRNYSYMKIRNGSYVDFVPNHYPLGYLMATYGREHYGKDFWKDVTTDAVRYRGLFYPLSHSLKKRTGNNVTSFYHAMLGEYQPYWNAYAARPDITPALTLTPATKTLTNYKYIYATGENEWVVLRNSNKNVAGIYKIGQDGKEQLLVRPGIGFDDYFSYNNGHIIWAAARFDARWSWKDFSVIRVYDVATGQTSTVSAKGKYFSPDISQDGRQIVAVVVAPSSHYSLELIDAGTGQTIKQLPNKENWFYTYPKFLPNNQQIISAIRNHKGEMALARISTEDGTTELLTDWSYKVLGIPSIKGDTVYYTASYKDVNNIYAITLADKQQFEVTDRANSVLHAAAAGDSLVFSEFTDRGYKLFKSGIKLRKVEVDQLNHSSWMKPDFAEGGNILEKVPTDSLPVKKYAQLTRPFNFHSWVPSFNDPEYGIALLGENILNTTSTSIGYTYNNNEGSSDFYGRFTFSGLFPYLSIGADYNINRNGIDQSRNKVYWNEATGFVGFTVPLNFTSGLYSRGLTFGSNYNVRHRDLSNKYAGNDLQFLSNTIIFSNQRIKALQNIYTHFGQYLAAQYNRTTGGLYAEQLYVRFDQYLPGFMQNHNIVLQGAYQERDRAFNYSFSDNFVYVRGYNKPPYTSIYKLGANYSFPIAYPDWGFAQLLYFKRIRANLFYDYSKTNFTLNNTRNQYSSTGGELYLDTMIGNTLPFSCGVRVSYLFDKDPVDNAKQRVEFIIPIQQLFNY
ncbi:hypothetical protein DVR12_18675 [Chitinophaga silvatica]|uniref:Uncharacterized protein n=1 Tax=Chitinophaga silvatica TaxID=2282649 RepID=A0A3E1Y6R1_9BACT|nr:hypothetical protein [Chitinophaga silvatica]RFS20588.1 hypothetical protein DVR12_18675 [Chitinophaga silvatica]